MIINFYFKKFRKKNIYSLYCYLKKNLYYNFIFYYHNFLLKQYVFDSKYD